VGTTLASCVQIGEHSRQDHEPEQLTPTSPHACCSTDLCNLCTPWLQATLDASQPWSWMTGRQSTPGSWSALTVLAPGAGGVSSAKCGSSQTVRTFESQCHLRTRLPHLRLLLALASLGSPPASIPLQMLVSQPLQVLLSQLPRVVGLRTVLSL
jgi:hypothetical protein